MLNAWPRDNLRLYQSTCLDGQSKTMNNLSQNTVCLDLLDFV
jgi:hypothetical protein